MDGRKGRAIPLAPPVHSTEGDSREESRHASLTRAKRSFGFHSKGFLSATVKRTMKVPLTLFIYPKNEVQTGS